MKKSILTFMLFAAGTCLFSQDFYFKPAWKEGEKKTVVIVREEVTIEDGEKTSEEPDVIDAEIKVIKENNDAYLLKITYENIAMQSAVEFYDKLGDELKEYRNLELVYEIDKETGAAELTNWEEAQAFMNESFEQINVLLDEKVPDMAPFAELAFMPITEMFNSKENIEAYMSDEIGYLLFPFGKQFSVGDTLVITDSEPNPFDPMQEVSASTRSYISKVDEKKKMCDITTLMELDMGGFKEMMKELMMGMAESFGVDDSLAEDKVSEMDDIEFDVWNTQVITFDFKASWPVKVVSVGKVLLKDPTRNSETTITTTATLK